MERQNRGKIIYLWWMPVIIFMVLIFCFSAQNGEASSEVSMGVTGKIVQQIATVVMPEHTEEEHTEIAQFWEPIVRKTAHFMEYACLAVLVAAALYHAHGMRQKKWIGLAWLLTACYAATDEFHQLFVAGRAGRLFDVGIDSLGAAFGLLCLWGLYQWRRNHKKGKVER